MVYARKVDQIPIAGGEHMTIYGVTKVHCDIAARMGNRLKEFMGWKT